MRVFLGITGASGAPYARRLLQSLAAADCEVGVSVSGAAIEVRWSVPGEERLRFEVWRHAADDPAEGLLAASGQIERGAP